MTPEEAIRSRIVGLSAVQALVGTRVYLDQTPQDPTYPLVLVYSAGDHWNQQLRGADGIGQARISVEARVHVDAGHDAYTEVMDLYTAFDGDGRGPAATGVFGWVGLVGPVQIANCAHRGSRDRFYDADVRRVLRMTQDYWVSYRYRAVGSQWMH